MIDIKYIELKILPLNERKLILLMRISLSYPGNTTLNNRYTIEQQININKTLHILLQSIEREVKMCIVLQGLEYTFFDKNGIDNSQISNVKSQYKF